MGGIIKEAEKAVNKIGKNLETNVGGALNEIGYAISTGNYSNLDQTLLKGTLGAAFDPGALNYKETNIERATREAQENAADQEREATAAKEKERLRGLADMLTASANARRLTPGMAQTLLGSGSGSAGLLFNGR